MRKCIYEIPVSWSIVLSQECLCLECRPSDFLTSAHRLCPEGKMSACAVWEYAAVVFFLRKGSQATHRFNSHVRGVSEPHSSFACTWAVLQCLTPLLSAHGPFCSAFGRLSIGMNFVSPSLAPLLSAHGPFCIASGRLSTGMNSV